jgi:hypothetical protein
MVGLDTVPSTLIAHEAADARRDTSPAMLRESTQATTSGNGQDQVANNCPENSRS